jgi:hypothetical protein
MYRFTETIAPEAALVVGILAAATPAKAFMRADNGENARTEYVCTTQPLLVGTYSSGASSNVPHHTFIPDWAVFQDLRAKWYQERGLASSITKIALCPSYQQIIGMGQDRAVPMILRQLQEEGGEPDHWFWALRYLTGVDPIPPEARGNMVAMAQTWLAWGATQGYATA